MHFEKGQPKNKKDFDVETDCLQPCGTLTLVPPASLRKDAE